MVVIILHIIIQLDFITIPTQGNATDFANDVNGFYGQVSGASNTRGLWLEDENPATDQMKLILLLLHQEEMQQILVI